MNRREYNQLKYEEASRMIFRRSGENVGPEVLARYFAPAAEAVRRSNVREFIKHAQGPSRKVNADIESRRRQLASLEADSKYTLPRPLSRLIDDGIFTFSFVERHKGKKRMSALYKVLSNLPYSDYKKLKEISDKKIFYIHLPNDTTMGSVKDVPANVMHIYLTTQLESASFEYCCFVCAHELGHIVLEHTLSAAGPQEYMEAEADQLAARWGFPRPRE